LAQAILAQVLAPHALKETPNHKTSAKAGIINVVANITIVPYQHFVEFKDKSHPRTF